MTSQHARQLRSLGIKTSRLHGESAEEVWYKQTRRIKSLISCQEQINSNQAILRSFHEGLRYECMRALEGAMAQASNNTEYLDYWDRQLWDIAEMMLKPNKKGDRCVSFAITTRIEQMLRFRLFANSTYVELLQVIDLWIKIFKDPNSAVDKAREREIARVLRQEKVEMGSGEECPICAEEVTLGQSVTILAPFCSHWFHSDCIKTWLMSGNAGHSTCPMCRATIELPGSN